MKTIKLLSLAVVMMTAILFCGCDASYVNHPIAGKAFWDYGGGGYGSMTVYVEFYSNGRFDYDYMTKTISGYDHVTYDKHFKWTVDGNTIKVYKDNSTYWKASARGKLEAEGYYDATANKVVLNGREYEYSHTLK